MYKPQSRNERGLGKYDAPLKVQFQRGYEDFKRGQIDNPFHNETMQYREWDRGFNKAYFDKLERVKINEQHRNRSTEMVGGEV